MTTASTINFKGLSGARYGFQACAMDTKFKATGGVYLVTQRTFEDRTYQTKASHRCLAIGHTENLAASLMTGSERGKLIAQGANCICVCACDDEARRVEIEKDLIEGHGQWGGQLHHLFRPQVPERAPGQYTNDATESAGINAHNPRSS